MGKTNWTKEQQRVIDTRKKNILVSASAGSGKTAVLVERIINLITDPNEDIDIDELLVVTFTRAAAAEMKERILNALEEMMQKDPGNEKISRQTVLIHSANISTIDSFCLDVIRNHFNEIDLDPSFRTGDEGEMKLLRKAVIDEILEEGYAMITGNGMKTASDKDNVNDEIQTAEDDDEAAIEKLFIEPEDFLYLVRTVETGKNDLKTGEYINRIYDYSRSYDDPDKWLDSCEAVYDEDTENANGPVLLENILDHIKEKIKGLYLREQALFSECDIEGAPEKYGDFFAKETEAFQKLYEKISQTDYAETGKLLSGFIFERIPSAGKAGTYDEYVKNLIKDGRDAIKSEYQELIKKYFYDTPEQIFEDIRLSGRTVRGLITLVREFAVRFEKVKRERNIIDFSDMEQLAYRILILKEGAKIVPSQAAKEYMGKFKSVMIDEYQDSNFLQEAILSAVSGDSIGVPNRFIVGDIKQSIYGFRLSRPEIFKQKALLYENSENGVRIDLQQNFRSREIVLNSVNAVMKQIMSEQVGGITYDQSHYLKPGTDRTVNKDPYSEVLLADLSENDSDTEETGRELEARMVAMKIRSIMETEEVYDSKNKVKRPVEYRDIAILSRSDSGRFEILQKALLNAGIPAYTESRAGYFDALEVRCVLDYLCVLDNPLQDVPLAAVLRSPMGGFSDEELARLKILSGAKSFAKGLFDLALGEPNSGEPNSEDQDSGDMVIHDIEDQAEKQLLNRLCAFFSKLKAYRSMIPYTPLNELISAIIKETGYDLYLTAMPEGQKRLANIDILIRKAEAFSKTSFKGVFNFINYLDKLKAEEVDFGEANVCDEGSNVVRIMTIHKSKGLEFPIVFMVNLGDRIGSGKTDPLLISGKYKIAINTVYPDKRIRTDSVYRRFIQEKIKAEELGEELRIIYVAMTRAKDRLILTGRVKDKEKALGKWQNTFVKGDALIPAMVTEASSYLEILMKAVCRTEGYFRINWITPGNITFSETVHEGDRLIKADMVDEINTDNVFDSVLRKKLEEASAFCYSGNQIGDGPVKLSVSDIKIKQIEEKGLLGEDGESLFKHERKMPLIPDFVLDEELDTTDTNSLPEGNIGAVRGTAYHRFLELWDYNKWAECAGITAETQIGDYGQVKTDEIRNALNEMVISGRIGNEEAALINLKDMEAFLNSDLGKRMAFSAVNGSLKREQMFMLGVDRFTKDPAICPSDESKPGLIQGIIDAYFGENGTNVIVDYKTDRVDDIDSLKERYEIQLDIYAKALERLTGVRTGKKIIYSFCLKKHIVL